MKVLFIGGTGNISSACVTEAIRAGMDVFLFNRGKTSQDVPPGATLIVGDISDRDRRVEMYQIGG